MEITLATPIAVLVRQVPAAIAVLQKHGVAFCCTGATPLLDACAHHGLDPALVLADIQQARVRQAPALADDAPIARVLDHIQVHHHKPLREELPRISAMLTKLVQRHGERLPDVLPPLQATFEKFRDNLVLHIARDPIEMPEAEHDAAVSAMQRMRALTNSYTPPDDACPTFRGAYYALAELERDTEAHLHLEHDILFPRILAHARAEEGRT